MFNGFIEYCRLVKSDLIKTKEATRTNRFTKDDYKLKLLVEGYTCHYCSDGCPISIQCSEYVDKGLKSVVFDSDGNFIKYDSTWIFYD